jgi:hypothetical protein
MNGILSAEKQQEVGKRIDILKADTQHLWGKMDVAQMLAHCSQAIESTMSDKLEKRGLISYLFGKIAKKQFFTKEHVAKNLPTAPNYKAVGSHNFEQEKARIKKLLQSLAQHGKDVLHSKVHPFFGTMTADEWDVIIYKHLDHHLKQFGA